MFFINLKYIELFQVCLMNSLIVSGLTYASKQILVALITEVCETYKTTVEHPAIHGLIDDMDLDADLQVIRSIVMKIELDEHGERDIETVPDPVAVCLKNVNDMLVIIQQELRVIKREAEISVGIGGYFFGWKKPTYQINLDNLIRYKNILDKRVNMLLRIIACFK